MLKVRVKRDTGKLRHLRFASQHLLKFLGAELTRICAAEYAIVVIVLHTFSFPHFVSYRNPENQMECLTNNPKRIDPVSNWHQISLDTACLE